MREGHDFDVSNESRENSDSRISDGDSLLHPMSAVPGRSNVDRNYH